MARKNFNSRAKRKTFPHHVFRDVKQRKKRA
ncbi:MULTISPECIES: DUF1661 domain-containing protein [Porphyromonas]|nr:MULTISPECIES: DUF1661 domain-containing protein [Porphyromonas]